MNDIKRKCQSLEEDQQGMKKKVNPKVLTMIDSLVFCLLVDSEE